MLLSKGSAATMLQSYGWVPISSTGDCFISDESPLLILVSDDEVVLQEKETLKIHHLQKQRFPRTDDGIKEAIDLAGEAIISLRSAIQG